MTDGIKKDERVLFSCNLLIYTLQWTKSAKNESQRQLL